MSCLSSHGYNVLPLTYHDRSHWCSEKHYLCFVYQCQDNVKLYQQAKFDENIPCGSRVMSLFTKRAQPTKIMLGEASSPFSIPSGWTMLKYICIQHLWPFSFKDLDRPNDAKWSLITVLHTSGWTMLKYTCKEILNRMNHTVQELWAFSLKELDPKIMLGEASSPFCIPVAGQC